MSIWTNSGNFAITISNISSLLQKFHFAIETDSKEPGTSFQVPVFAELFGKKFPFIIRYKLAKFH